MRERRNLPLEFRSATITTIHLHHHHLRPNSPEPHQRTNSQHHRRQQPPFSTQPFNLSTITTFAPQPQNFHRNHRQTTLLRRATTNSLLQTKQNPDRHLPQPNTVVITIVFISATKQNQTATITQTTIITVTALIPNATVDHQSNRS